MQTKIPKFSYLPYVGQGRHLPCIKTGGELIHRIEDSEVFYKALGFTQDMAKEGKLPDEFIWEEYVRDAAANGVACFQMQIIEYLKKHSVSFRKKYGDQYESWIAAYAKAIAAGSE